MARRTFFAFHFDHDIFRVNQVRNSNVVAGPDGAGFYDHSEYEDAKKHGFLAIQKMIRRHLENTTVTVVLIGTYTASRPWVQFEIAESVKRKNGLLGIRIHHLQNSRGQVSQPGPVPAVVPGVDFPVYIWDSSNVSGFATVIEQAGKRSDDLRRAAATTLLPGWPRTNR
jgi:antiphage defense system Thoeris ThsB-like protein